MLHTISAQSQWPSGNIWSAKALGPRAFTLQEISACSASSISSNCRTFARLHAIGWYSMSNLADSFLDRSLLTPHRSLLTFAPPCPTLADSFLDRSLLTPDRSLLTFGTPCPTLADSSDRMDRRSLCVCCGSGAVPDSKMKLPPRGG
jgi:hypothetical protein